MSAFDEDEYLRIVGLKPRTTRKAQVVEDYLPQKLEPEGSFATRATFTVLFIVAVMILICCWRQWKDEKAERLDNVAQQQQQQSAQSENDSDSLSACTIPSRSSVQPSAPILGFESDSNLAKAAIQINEDLPPPYDENMFRKQ